MKKEILIDVVGAVGVGLLSYGAWAIYEPSGFIVGGGCLLGLAVAIGKGGK